MLWKRWQNYARDLEAEVEFWRNLNALGPFSGRLGLRGDRLEPAQQRLPRREWMPMLIPSQRVSDSEATTPIRLVRGPQ